MSRQPMESADKFGLRKLSAAWDNDDFTILLTGKHAHYIREMSKLVGTQDQTLINFLIEREAKKFGIL